jgi:hypothetical protein
MSEQRQIIVPFPLREVDIVDEITSGAGKHAPARYLAWLTGLPEAQRTSAITDFVITVRQLIREFPVCHDLALSQLVRSGKGSAAAQKMLLAGGLEKLLGIDSNTKTTIAEAFYKAILGPMPPKSGPHGTILESTINTLRNRMVNLCGSERVGVGLGGVSAVYAVSVLTLAPVTSLARNRDVAVSPLVTAAGSYETLLHAALRDLSLSLPGRRAIAFGATQGFALCDDLFAFLLSRTPRHTA